MCDQAGVHITRIYINNSRKPPSPIHPSDDVPVRTSTPISIADTSNLTPQQQMALIAKEVLASQRSSSEVFNQQNQSPPYDQYIFISKETGQQIDLSTGGGINKVPSSSSGTIHKKKKVRRTIATIPSSSSRMYF